MAVYLDYYLAIYLDHYLDYYLAIYLAHYLKLMMDDNLANR